MALGLVGAPADDMPTRGSSSYVAAARLAPGASFAAAQAEHDPLGERFLRA